MESLEVHIRDAEDGAGGDYRAYHMESPIVADTDPDFPMIKMTLLTKGMLKPGDRLRITVERVESGAKLMRARAKKEVDRARMRELVRKFGGRVQRVEFRLDEDFLEDPDNHDPFHPPDVLAYWTEQQAKAASKEDGIDYIVPYEEVGRSIRAEDFYTLLTRVPDEVFASFVVALHRESKGEQGIISCRVVTPQEIVGKLMKKRGNN